MFRGCIGGVQGVGAGAQRAERADAATSSIACKPSFIVLNDVLRRGARHIIHHVGSPPSFIEMCSML